MRSPKIDLWFIDKIAILDEMEYALKTRELDEDLLREAKRMEFGLCDCKTERKDRRKIKEMRKHTVSPQLTRW